MYSRPKGFTLIELLVVIAIIAILSVVVILSLNPSELLRQARDSNRLSDLATLNSALGLYSTDQSVASSFSLGSSSLIYVSLPDSSSTCGSWSLPTPPTNYSYACSSSTSSRNINSTGWIPVNFSLMSSGAPFGNLPVDSINQSSTGLYYTYSTNGTQFIATAVPESQKQKASFGAKPQIPNYPDVMANGSNLAISPLFNPLGLTGYWNFDEGMGSTTLDLSGNNYNGAWNGSTTNGSYYATGKVGPYAGQFDGNTDWVDAGMATSTQIGTGDWSASMWVYTKSSSDQVFVARDGGGSPNDSQFCMLNTDYWMRVVGPISGSVQFYTSNAALINQWVYATLTISRSGQATIYINGVPWGNAPSSPIVGQNVISGLNFFIGKRNLGSTPRYFNGFIDDVRVYNRALSAAEIQAIYNAEK